MRKRFVAASHSSRTSVTVPTSMPRNSTGRADLEASHRLVEVDEPGVLLVEHRALRRRPALVQLEDRVGRGGGSCRRPPACRTRCRRSRMLTSDSVSTRTPSAPMETSSPLAFQKRVPATTRASNGAFTNTCRRHEVARGVELRREHLADPDLAEVDRLADLRRPGPVRAQRELPAGLVGRHDGRRLEAREVARALSLAHRVEADVRAREERPEARDLRARHPRALDPEPRAFRQVALGVLHHPDAAHDAR